MIGNKNWLVFANRDKCHHAEALYELGFVNWRSRKNFKMSIGDYVYLYVSDERRVRFKTQVVAENCERQDDKFWQDDAKGVTLYDPTYKLQYRDEYKGHELDDAVLREHGFNGGGSILTPNYKNTELLDYIESIFGKKRYGHIIDEVIPQERSRELARLIIPILIRWAKQGQTNKTYNHLIKELGYKIFSGIGKQLGKVDKVFKRFREETGDDTIPMLNSLVKDKDTMLPSEGFSIVYPNYEKMTNEEKKLLVVGLDTKAIEYQYWDWVLAALELVPSKIDTAVSETAIRSGKFYGLGGEGEHHKQLKEYIYSHPETLGIKDVKERDMEHILLSGDRLDVFFVLNDGSKIAIEIKPSTSPDADVMRGLYQCVKYKTIMDAEDKVHGNKNNNISILVIGGTLSSENKKVSDVLNITVVEELIIKLL
jgi:hypothetical protein